MYPQNILVTGSHRSGTTWLGHILTATGELDYIHEPFNLDIAMTYDSPVKHWYEYVGADKTRQDQFSEYLEAYSKGRLSSIKTRILRSRARKIPSIIRSETHKFLHRSTPKVVKDPLALFSADYFADVLNYDVLVTIRHPAAFAESLKNKKWSHDFSHFLSQAELMETVIPQFRDEIEELMASESKKESIIEQAILLWKLIHSRILHYQENREKWLFVKHESLSLHPHEEFERIFKHYNIPLNKKAEAYIRKTTSGSETTGKLRDSKKNVTKWTRSLSGDEVSMIYKNTAEIANEFYSKSEWYNTI